ncbi:hypothetical protein A3A95_03910 [Candidatus Nomurabacteria bacterium RIFCSPLOWO2_01_FULL_39_18]|uniref:Uncharacterized protein n=1 Tax=Candidatus Nomurabacteria bacterium RIFCSPHIGHO2_01_FULL_40_24b TaxID=1801739 RepID=A0A1F6V6S3_9BACT|nr:MAG: hypothetical protein A2647_04610 [Candidatus Nomurabacteria bacterium RIFCSPHIGHO2_01_FULL_40_24b]OGI89252.1 MAG: hypothetical protein A3A95_03910 [Candidatus Nomurabacteria bacterium RIFCSPLOWO2_01_FULL_39_18]
MEETRVCQNCKNSFTIDASDFGFYEKIKVPPPTWCPECRLKRRLSWQGYQILYKRKCDFTGEEVITTHHKDSPYKVYRQDIWWSDKWDPKEHGREIDWSRSFLEQFGELMRDVPLPALYTEHASMVRSDYCNAAAECKDCYLCFRIDYAENCAYLNEVADIKDSIDCSWTRHDQMGYGNVITHSSYQTFFCEDVVGSMNMWFCRSCVGCSDCVGCANLTKKKYHIFNEPYSKEEFQKIFKKYDFGSVESLEKFRKSTMEFLLTQPRKQFNDRNSVNTTGEYVYNSKNVHDSYMVRKAKDCRYCQFLKAGPIADCYDYTEFGERGELIYESCWVGLQVSNIKFSVWNYNASNLEFCFGCHSSNNMFGCVGIKKGEYCILNKRYSKEEYLKITEKLRKQMMEIPYIDKIGRIHKYGEMMPSEISPWAYNESTSMEWFPLGKGKAIKEGFAWRDVEPKDYQDATIRIPKHIRDVKDDIVNEILKCEKCGKNYRLIKMEIDFYRRFNLPIPHNCPLCRDRARTKLLNPIEIHDRKCAKCGKDIKTSWSADKPEIVYCEKCYQAEVY